MLISILSLALELSAVAGPAYSPAAIVVQACEVVGPRLDGVRVTVCNGAAVAYTDANGNTFRPGDWR